MDVDALKEQIESLIEANSMLSSKLACISRRMSSQSENISSLSLINASQADELLSLRLYKERAERLIRRMQLAAPHLDSRK